jgi:hypothetical protein
MCNVERTLNRAETQIYFGTRGSRLAAERRIRPRLYFYIVTGAHCGGIPTLFFSVVFFIILPTVIVSGIYWSAKQRGTDVGSFSDLSQWQAHTKPNSNRTLRRCWVQFPTLTLTD